MQQLSAQDAQFLYMETNKSSSHVTTVSIFDPSTAPGGSVRFKQIIDHVESRLHTSPIYKRRLYHVPLELDYPYWINDEHFDIEYHIRHGRLPHPADWRQFCIHLARFHSRPLDMQRAPWEMYVIEGLDHIDGIPKGAYALTTKIHHAAADGMAIAKFFGGLTDIDALGTPAMPHEAKITSKRYEKPGPLQMGIRSFINTAKSPVKIADTLLRHAPAIVKASVKQFKNANEEAKQTVPGTRFNLETSPHRVFDAAFFELADIKAIRALAPGSTVNDVVLAICSGALRQYLIHHKELPIESLRAFVPINVRGKKGNAEKDQEPGNNISTMAPTLYTNIEDPVERLQQIFLETRSQKATKKGISARLMTDVTRHVPASTQLLAARLVFSSELSGRVTNVCISNVPGPAIPVYMNGARCIAALGLGPLSDRMGLFLAITSYCGRMSINVTSCRRTMPDIDFFIDCINTSFETLKEAAQSVEKSTVRTRKKSTKSAKRLPTNRKKRSKKVSTKSS